MRSETFGTIVFYVQVAVYLILLSYSLVSTFKPTLDWFLLTRWGAFHLRMVWLAMAFALYVRVRLPKTINGFAYSLITVWGVGAIYELFFDLTLSLYQLHTSPIYVNLHYDAFMAFGIIALFATKAYRNFNLKILALGFLGTILVTGAWIWFAGYHVSVCSCSYHYKYALDLSVNAWEILAWTVWFIAGFVGFKNVRESPTE
jgi:hypothetical protein